MKAAVERENALSLEPGDINLETPDKGKAFFYTCVMHKYQLETPKHLIHANGTGDTSLEGEFYCENYKEQIKSLSKDEDTFYASPEEAITRMSSNHPKRMINPDITLNLLCESEEKIEHAYSINTYHPEMENQILIAGDSHAEFYSRIPWRSKSEWSHACLWTGATTCIGFATDSSSIEMITSILESLSPQGDKNFKLILSFGEIDVRHLMYGTIIVNKYFKSPSQYMQFVKPQLEKQINKLKSLNTLVDIGILQPTPTTSTKSYGNPMSTEELKDYYHKTSEHPVLGNPEFRRNVERECNFMEDFCYQNELTYIQRCKESFISSNLLNPKHTHDGCHLSSKQC